MEPVKQVPEVFFWQNVAMSESDQCWEWQGKREPKGYGYFCMNATTFRVHRFSYELHHGPIPKGLLVCHKCDNPPCVNPEHLFIGTNADNTNDRIAKGRGRRAKAVQKPKPLKAGDRVHWRHTSYEGVTSTITGVLLHTPATGHDWPIMVEADENDVYRGRWSIRPSKLAHL